MSINNMKTSRLSTYLASKSQPEVKDPAVDNGNTDPQLMQDKAEDQQENKSKPKLRKAIREPKPTQTTQPQAVPMVPPSNKTH